MLAQHEVVRQWLSEDVLNVIQQRVSLHYARPWRILHALDRTEFASHPAAVLSGAGFAVFVKLGAGPLAADRFQQELTGLHLLSTRAGVLTPAGIGVVEIEGGAVLIMEAVQEVERDPAFWRQMGQALAQLHRAKGARFGLETHCYWGDLYQDNTPTQDWVEFFRARRLAPRLKAAFDSGHLPAILVTQIEQIETQLPQLCGSAPQPSLLHGDAHKNNCLASPHGPIFIDPSVYYGHPEMDLAYVDFFEPAPAEFFAAYAEVTPLEPGFAERRALWQIPAWLAMVQVGGPGYLDKLDAAVRHYR
ncbi:fructosamine kinase family protein [Caldilinea sp.]|uniref:fructosamine kinase family protein n=1 Tax=Caldilinea sp. TaxID=2293560 RepID=UPI002B70942C|nr:fructosamine kinase family protein [Caldilinea sp.]HRA67705.1 fructosamine kinase family protein [Caldilinea sp.]